MCDEMQLKCGIVFHSRSNDVTGLTTDGDGMLLNQEISDLLSQSNISKDGSLVKDTIGVGNKGVATYVNQWYFRSCYNETSNLGFFSMREIQKVVK